MEKKSHILAFRLKDPADARGKARMYHIGIDWRVLFDLQEKCDKSSEITMEVIHFKTYHTTKEKSPVFLKTDQLGKSSSLEIINHDSSIDCAFDGKSPCAPILAIEGFLLQPEFVIKKIPSFMYFILENENPDEEFTCESAVVQMAITYTSKCKVEKI